MEDEVKLPTQPGAPTSEHGQMMYALGLINGTLKGIQARQDVTNGKVIKAGDDIKEIQKWQSEADGKDIGVSKVSLIILNIITAIVAIVALVLKFVK